jgi:AraC-like DNA-binding protein
MTNLSVLLIGDCRGGEPRAGRFIRHVRQILVDGGAEVRLLTPGSPIEQATVDAVVVVFRERNRSYSGTIKTLLDSLDTRTVSGKPCGLISYGEARPASTAIDHLRVVIGALGGVPVADGVNASLTTAVTGAGTIGDEAAESVSTLVAQVLSYPRGRPVRERPEPAHRRPRVVEPAGRIGFEPAVPVDGSVYEGITLAVSYIKENYWDQNLSLDSVASAVYMSRYHFSRKFRQETGRRFIDYLIMLRMTAARKLLLQTNRTVTAIAAEVGYRDLSNFERSFKKLYGTQPSQYRQRYAEPAPERDHELVQLRRLETGPARRRPA